MEHASNIEKPGLFENHPWLRPVTIGVVAGAGALLLAPAVLPMLGFGTSQMASQAIASVHSINATGSGLAGIINSALASIPGIGASLAEGRSFTAIASGAIGFGGIIAGKYLQKKDDGTSKVNWGKLIKNTALITSVLIALPSILAGLSVGLVFLAHVFGGNALASSVATATYKTLGSISASQMGTSLAAGSFAAVPHVITCGASLMPAAFTISQGHNSHTPTFEERAFPSPPPEHNHNYTDGSIEARIVTPQPLVANQPVQAKLILTHRGSNRPVTPDDLSINHTRKVHLFVVDQSLRDYFHIHPTPGANPGEYNFSFTPNTMNNYSAWADIKLVRDGKAHRLKTAMPSALRRSANAFVPNNSKAFKNGMAFDWNADTRLRQNSSSMVEVTVTDDQGRPVTDLQPIMGAQAHLVGFSADGQSLIHAHPMHTAPGDPNLRFHIAPDFCGPVQLYLQVRRNDEDTYVSFGQQVAPSLVNSRGAAVCSPSGSAHTRA